MSKEIKSVRQQNLEAIKSISSYGENIARGLTLTYKALQKFGTGTFPIYFTPGLKSGELGGKFSLAVKDDHCFYEGYVEVSATPDREEAFRTEIGSLLYDINDRRIARSYLYSVEDWDIYLLNTRGQRANFTSTLRRKFEKVLKDVRQGSDILKAVKFDITQTEEFLEKDFNQIAPGVWIRKPQQINFPA